MNKFKIGQRWMWKNISHYIIEIITENKVKIIYSFSNDQDLNLIRSASDYQHYIGENLLTYLKGQNKYEQI